MSPTSGRAQHPSSFSLQLEEAAKGSPSLLRGLTGFALPAGICSGNTLDSPTQSLILLVISGKAGADSGEPQRSAWLCCPSSLCAGFLIPVTVF